MPRLVKPPAQVGFEFLHQQRHALLAPAAMADGVLDLFLKHAAVVENHAQRIGDRALPGVVIVARELRLFDTFDPGAQGVDAGSEATASS